MIATQQIEKIMSKIDQSFGQIKDMKSDLTEQALQTKKLVKDIECSGALLPNSRGSANTDELADQLKQMTDHISSIEVKVTDT